MNKEKHLNNEGENTPIEGQSPSEAPQGTSDIEAAVADEEKSATETGGNADASEPVYDVKAPENGHGETEGTVVTEASRPPAESENRPDLKAMLADAEMTGYLRGRNESIEQLMKMPGIFERIATVRPQPEPDSGRNSPEILARRRVSIWDK